MKKRLIRMASGKDFPDTRKVVKRLAAGAIKSLKDYAKDLYNDGELDVNLYKSISKANRQDVISHVVESVIEKLNKAYDAVEQDISARNDKEKVTLKDIKGLLENHGFSYHQEVISQDCDPVFGYSLPVNGRDLSVYNIFYEDFYDKSLDESAVKEVAEYINYDLDLMIKT